MAAEYIMLVKKYAKSHGISIEEVIVWSCKNEVIVDYQYFEEGHYWEHGEEVLYAAPDNYKARMVASVLKAYIKSQEVY